ncbi:hypothetical protein BC940DRAFT_155810 [Gongronella butleri]|nr:hypothetical protein BC940DRAFT_155810 [Gongronella butleri]
MAKKFFKSSLSVGRQQQQQPKGASTVPAPAQQHKDTQTSEWIEQALQKANTAVLFDYTNAPKSALDAYLDAMALLDKVFKAVNPNDDHTRLQKIYETYRDRVVHLRQQLTDADLDASSPISIPIAAPAVTIKPSSPVAPASMPASSNSSNAPPLPPKDPPAPNPVPSTSASSRFRARRPSTASIDTTFSATSATSATSKKSASIFASMFQKREGKANTASKNTPVPPMPPIPSTSSSTAGVGGGIFNMPMPSRSTPTLSMSRPSFSWKKSSKDKKQKQEKRHSIELQPSPSTLTLTLPQEVGDGKKSNKADYFDLHTAAETKHLLYAQPEPILESMRDLHTKDELDDSLTTCSSTSSLSLEDKEPMHATKFNAATATAPPQLPPLPVASSSATTASSATANGHPPAIERSSSNSSNRTNSSKPLTATKMQQTNSTLSQTSTTTQPTLTSSASSIMTNRSSTQHPTTTANNSNSHPSNTNASSLSFFSIREDDAPFSSMFPAHTFLQETDNAMDNLAKVLADSAAAAAILEASDEPNGTHNGPSRPGTTSNSPLPPLPPLPPAHYHPLAIDVDMTPRLSLDTTADNMTVISTTASTVATRDDLYDISSLGSLPSPTPSSSTTTSTKSFWFKRNKSMMRNKRPQALHIHPPLHEHVDYNDDDATTQASYNPVTPPPMTATSFKSSAPSTPRHWYFRTNNIHRGVDISVAMDTHTNPDKQSKLMARLHQSMTHGGYITDRIHAPKELWHQTHMRLPHIDAKIATSDQLLTVLLRMQTRNLLDHHHCLYDLGCLEQILDQIRQSFAKGAANTSSSSSSTANGTAPPLPVPSTSSAYPQNAAEHNNETTSTWSSKFSKSMERMKLETTAMSTDEQVSLYIDTLIKLFALAHVFDDWRNRYMDLCQSTSMEKAYLYDHLLQKTMMCSGTFHSIVCGFVMRDFSLFLNKWIKRTKDWILDD